MADYSEEGFNGFLQKSDSPLFKLRQEVIGYDFDMQYEVQTKTLRSSRVSLGSIVQQSVGNNGTGDFSLGSVLTLSSTITFNVPLQTNPMHGNAYIAIYQGTTLTSANQIYPVRGGSVTPGRYQVQGGYDGHTWDFVSNNWRGQLTDTTGTSSQVITFSANWNYLYYNTGTAA